MTMDVLLTGASGFIGLHVLKLLLDRGHDVVAVVRNDKRTKDVKRVSAQYPKGKVKIAYIPDFAADNAFDEVFQKHYISAVIHTAIPAKKGQCSNPENEIVQPAVKGMENLLHAITSFAPQVVKLVYTSSIYTCVDDHQKGGHLYFTEKDWAYTTLDEAVPGDMISYSKVAKTLSEMKLWRFVFEKKPNFDVISINPALVCGPPLQRVQSLEDLNVSSQVFWKLVTGQIPQDTMGEYIDVRECAMAHVMALRPELKMKRWLVFKEDFVAKKFVEIARLGEPDDSVEPTKLLKDKPKIDTSTFLNDTKMKFRSLRETITDTLAVLRSQGLIPEAMEDEDAAFTGMVPS